MARTHERPSSPAPTSPEGSESKRLKTSHNTTNGDEATMKQFAEGTLDAGNIQKLNNSYTTSDPFKYAVVDTLFQNNLLINVKDECLRELCFTEKETDIYKVRQTGDLASLSYLSPDLLSRLPSLLTLRDALYSPTFRAFIRSVTGCGPLSGTKQDMSVNNYTKGCHLLNHDDVIGTRRVSYILYMPLPATSQWKEEWGGALELYETRLGKGGIPEPVATPCKKIPPSWNQFVFFEVQPGQSFHSVEEVVVGGEGDEDGRARLSISGWFHAPQEGEEGYELASVVKEVKSSREQLTSTASTSFKSYPNSEHPPTADTPLAMSEDHISFLSEFLNPVYLQTRTMNALASRFFEESSLELHSFLATKLANKLEHGLREVDMADELDGASRHGRIPPHNAGTELGPWRIKSPPHKQRYCVLEPYVYGPPEEGQSKYTQASSDEMLRSLQDELFPSNAFRAWLSIVSRLLPLRYSVESRRFRPGLDYTLAVSEERETRLDVVLGLTPDMVTRRTRNGKGKARQQSNGEEKPKGFATGEWGGWECYMAPHDEDDDPAVYRSGSGKPKRANGSRSPRASPRSSPNAQQNGNGNGNGNGTTGSSNGNSEPPADTNGNGEHVSDDGEEEDDGTLLTVHPGYNRLLLVLRDEGVMRFVKYVSAAAESSRWDVSGEYEVGMMQQVSDSEEASD